MSEKKRKKKDGENKEKNEQPMHEASQDANKKEHVSRSQRKTALSGAKG